jgi:nucleoside-diphosphate-sugar epimerase
MRIFVTGASGFIGSHVTAELLEAGHEVVGLARSDASAAIVAAAGAEVLRGTIEELELLRDAAAASDGVVHTAYNHDFSNMQLAAQADHAAIDAIASVLDGTDRPFAYASGTLGIAPGRVATEQDAGNTSPRANDAVALALAERGIRSSAVRLSPSVHDEYKRGFVGYLVDTAIRTGFSGYLGDGSSRWPTVHVLDAARLFRLAIESAPAGSVLHGVGEEGVATGSIAEAIGRNLDLPVQAVAQDQASEHFGFMAMFLELDSPASNEITRNLLDWAPTHRGLIEDLDSGHWFDR